MKENNQVIFSLNAEQALNAMQSSAQGLSTIQAKERLAIYGANELKPTTYRSIIVEAIAHSTNPLVAILIIAALVSGFSGNLANAIIIISVVLISIILDYFQSHRSLVAAEKLQTQVATKVTVLRDNQKIELIYRELVPGDVIFLQAGDLIPADCLLIEAKDLHVQQAALTGESLPVEKEVGAFKNHEKNSAEAKNAVFAGSSVVSGHAMALVIATGQKTLFGDIAKNLKQAPPPSEFDKGILHFGLFIMKTVVFLVLFVFLVNLYLKHPPLESLLFSIALAVGLTPEFLPMITTVTLATGALRMAKQDVIVKHLAAIQNFGSIDILCSDKTGTITQGEMSLAQYINLHGEKSDYVLLLGYLHSLFSSTIKNSSDQTLIKKTGINPMDTAVLHHDHPNILAYSKLDEIPFDFERRCSSIVVEKMKQQMIITKGAPEQVINLCTHFSKTGEDHFLLTEQARQEYAQCFIALSEQGYRVLAIAAKPLAKKEAYHHHDENELCFIGFLAFYDPPLADAKKMIYDLNQAGVKIKILTGDNDRAASYICKQVGLSTQRIILGDEIETMSDPALAKIAEEVDIFARVSPRQKLRIVNALRLKNHVVGYMGDGINDAPSLHNADVGISVSGAVDVAREAADIILLKQHLGVLLNGILEGRKSFGNVMKYLMMGTSSNFGNMLSMALAAPFLPFLPMKSTQILLNNLLYDISQITIPTDNVDKLFTRKPKHWNIGIIRRFMFFIGPISSIFDFLTFYVMLNLFKATESLFQTAWFVESLATQTLVIFVIRTLKNPFESRPSLALTITVLMVVALGIWLPFSPLASILGFTPLPFNFFIFLILATFSYLIIVELIKRKLLRQWLNLKI